LFKAPPGKHGQVSLDQWRLLVLLTVLAMRHGLKNPLVTNTSPNKIQDADEILR